MPAAAASSPPALQPLLGLLDELSDAVVLLGRDGRIAHANPSALRRFGLEAGSHLAQWAPVLGSEVLDWVAARLPLRAPAGRAAMALADRRRVSLAWQPLDERLTALRIAVLDEAAGPGRGSAASPAPHPAADREGAGPLEALRESPFPASLQDAEFRIVDCNAALLSFLGRTREEVIGADPMRWVPAEDRPAMQEQRQRLGVRPDRGDVPALIERRVIDTQGRERWFRASRQAVAGPRGERWLLAIYQDCSAEHQARERAERSLRELDQWFDLATVGMVLFDSSGLLVRTNPAFEGLLGDTPVSLADAPQAIQRLLGWSALGMPAAIVAGGAWKGDAVVERPDGLRRALHAIVRAYPNLGGSPRYLAVVEDRSAEYERDLARSQIGALMDTAGVGLVTLQAGRDGRPFVGAEPTTGGASIAAGAGAAGGVNAGAGTAGDTGRGAALLQSIHRELVLPESLPDYERLQQALRRSQRTEVRYAIRHPQFGQRWLLTRVEPTELASGERRTSVVTLDITETQQAQIRSEQLLRELTTILEGTTAGIAYVRADVLVRCNPRFEAMLGLPGGRAVGSSLHELFGRYPQARRVAEETLQALTRDGVFETEIELPQGGRPADDANPRWVSLSVRRALEPSPVPEAIAVLTDITRLKAQQRDLEVLLRDRELMFSLSEVGIAFLRGDAVVRANEALSRISGYPVEALAGLPVERLFPDLEAFERMWSDEVDALAVTGRWTGERQLRRQDGRPLWVQVSKRLVVEGEPAAGVIASYVNVDDRHRAEEAVAMQAERTRAVLDSVLVGIVTVGPHGIEWMNRSARRMFAGDLADFIGMPIDTVATPDPDHPFRRTQAREEMPEGQAETFECQVKARDGREFWVVGNVVAIGRDSVDRQLTYALLDIERRRQAEARIVETQASLQRIIEAAPMSITLVNSDTLQVMQANQAAASAAQRPVAELIGRRPDEWLAEADAATQLRDLREAVAAAVPTQRETREQRGGVARIWETRYVPVGTAAEPSSQLLVVSTDVTEQRTAQEARFEAALAQREMLVKEVHHRIKNNLQGVAGLLEQIAKRKPEVADTIAEVVAQVQAIAQVYGLQVGVSGALRVDPVVRAITQSVERTFGRTIRFTVESDPTVEWVLPEAESIPIALTLNELLTNAIKHSAAGAGVTCHLRSDQDSVQVSIANTGQLPTGFQLERFPMGVSGLGLVRALLPRRSATLTLESAGGSVVARVQVRPPGVRRDNLAPS